MLVLVADEDQNYAELIGELLRRRSHRVVLAATEDSFHDFVGRSSADLIVVSAGLVRGSASGLVRELAQRQEGRIIVTFDDDASSMEIAASLSAGADDCIRKPFHPAEFAARVDVVGARAGNGTRTNMHTEPVEARTQNVAAVIPAPELTGRGLEFDTTRERAFYNGKDLKCSRLEYTILRTMAGMEGQVLSHALLNHRVWGYSNLGDGTLLKGHVSSLRRKLRDAGFDGSLIRTIYGVGYALSA